MANAQWRMLNREETCTYTITTLWTGAQMSGSGGYSDVQMSTTRDGAKVAAVVYEYDSCSSYVALVDPTQLWGVEYGSIAAPSP